MSGYFAEDIAELISSEIQSFFSFRFPGTSRSQSEQSGNDFLTATCEAG